MAGEKKWWTIKDAQARLDALGTPASDTTVRSYLAKDWLRGWYTGGNHARIEPASVDELALLLQMPLGPDRAQALEDLAASNRARRDNPAGD